MSRAGLRSGGRSSRSGSPFREEILKERLNLNNEEDHISETSLNSVEFQISAAIEILRSPDSSLQMSSDISLTRDGTDSSGSKFKKICKECNVIMDSEEYNNRFYQIEPYSEIKQLISGYKKLSLPTFKFSKFSRVFKTEDDQLGEAKHLIQKMINEYELQGLVENPRGILEVAGAQMYELVFISFNRQALETLAETSKDLISDCNKQDKIVEDYELTAIKRDYDLKEILVLEVPVSDSGYTTWARMNEKAQNSLIQIRTALTAAKVEQRALRAAKCSSITKEEEKVAKIQKEAREQRKMDEQARQNALDMTRHIMQKFIPLMIEALPEIVTKLDRRTPDPYAPLPGPGESSLGISFLIEGKLALIYKLLCEKDKEEHSIITEILAGIDLVNTSTKHLSDNDKMKYWNDFHNGLIARKRSKCEYSDIIGFKIVAEYTLVRATEFFAFVLRQKEYNNAAIMSGSISGDSVLSLYDLIKKFQEETSLIKKQAVILTTPPVNDSKGSNMNKNGSKHMNYAERDIQKSHQNVHAFSSATLARPNSQGRGNGGNNFGNQANTNHAGRGHPNRSQSGGAQRSQSPQRQPQPHQQQNHHQQQQLHFPKQIPKFQQQPQQRNQKQEDRSSQQIAQHACDQMVDNGSCNRSICRDSHDPRIIKLARDRNESEQTKNKSMGSGKHSVHCVEHSVLMTHVFYEDSTALDTIFEDLEYEKESDYIIEEPESEEIIDEEFILPNESIMKRLNEIYARKANLDESSESNLDIVPATTNNCGIKLLKELLTECDKKRLVELYAPFVIPGVSFQEALLSKSSRTEKGALPGFSWKASDVDVNALIENSKNDKRRSEKLAKKVILDRNATLLVYPVVVEASTDNVLGTSNIEQVLNSDTTMTNLIEKPLLETKYDKTVQTLVDKVPHCETTTLAFSPLVIEAGTDNVPGTSSIEKGEECETSTTNDLEKPLLETEYTVKCFSRKIRSSKFNSKPARKAKVEKAMLSNVVYDNSTARTGYKRTNRCHGRAKKIGHRKKFKSFSREISTTSEAYDPWNSHSPQQLEFEIVKPVEVMLTPTDEVILKEDPIFIPECVKLDALFPVYVNIREKHVQASKEWDPKIIHFIISFLIIILRILETISKIMVKQTSTVDSKYMRAVKDWNSQTIIQQTSTAAALYDSSSLSRRNNTHRIVMIPILVKELDKTHSSKESIKSYSRSKLIKQSKNVNIMLSTNGRVNWKKRANRKKYKPLFLAEQNIALSNYMTQRKALVKEFLNLIDEDVCKVKKQNTADMVKYWSSPFHIPELNVSSPDIARQFLINNIVEFKLNGMTYPRIRGRTLTHVEKLSMNMVDESDYEKVLEACGTEYNYLCKKLFDPPQYHTVDFPTNSSIEFSESQDIENGILYEDLYAQKLNSEADKLEMIQNTAAAVHMHKASQSTLSLGGWILQDILREDEAHTEAVRFGIEVATEFANDIFEEAFENAFKVIDSEFLINDLTSQLIIMEDAKRAREIQHYSNCQKNTMSEMGYKQRTKPEIFCHQKVYMMQDNVINTITTDFENDCELDEQLALITSHEVEKFRPPFSVILTLDTAASISMTETKRTLINLIQLVQRINVSGINGNTEMEAIGRDIRFGEKFGYIKDSNLKGPILSVGRWNGKSNGKYGVSVFLSEYGFQYREDPTTKYMMKKLEDYLIDTEQVSRFCKKVNNVYVHEMTEKHISDTMDLYNGRSAEMINVISSTEEETSVNQLTRMMDSSTLTDQSESVNIALIEGDFTSCYGSFNKDELEISIGDSDKLLLHDDIDFSENNDSTSEEVNSLSLDLYSHRMKFPSTNVAMEFLSKNHSRRCLLDMVARKSCGTPEFLTQSVINKFFKDTGPTVEHQMAQITKAINIDRVYTDRVFKDMESWYLDEFQAFGSTAYSEKLKRRIVIPAYSGVTHVYLAVCKVSGAAILFTSVDGKNKCQIVKQLIEKVLQLCNTEIQEITTDHSFMSVEAHKLLPGNRLRQGQPHDHSIWNGLVEGAIRWIKEANQTNMNFLLQKVKDNVITSVQASRLWLDTVQNSVLKWNLCSHSSNKQKSRFEVLHKRPHVMSQLVNLPFAWELIVKSGHFSPTGRGITALFLNPSEVVDGGVQVFDPITSKKSIAFSMKTSNATKRHSDTQLQELIETEVGEFVHMREVEVVPNANVDEKGDLIEIDIDKSNTEDDPAKRIAQLRSDIEAATAAKIKAGIARIRRVVLSKDTITNFGNSAAKVDSQSNNRSERMARWEKVRIEDEARELARLEGLESDLSVLTTEDLPLIVKSRAYKSLYELLPPSAKAIQKQYWNDIMLKKLNSHDLDSHINCPMAESVHILDYNSDTELIYDHEFSNNSVLEHIVQTTIDSMNESTRGEPSVEAAMEFERNMCGKGHEVFHLTAEQDAETDRVMEAFNTSTFLPINDQDAESQAVGTSVFEEYHVRMIQSNVTEMTRKILYMEDVLSTIAMKESIEPETNIVNIPLSARPPKPKVPPARLCIQDPKWMKADDREAVKINDEVTMIGLPKDAYGKHIIPPMASIQSLLVLREYKWKVDPDTGLECWLPCCRMVVDGSMDTRPDEYYALTPDRILLFMIISIALATGSPLRQADVTRAYLNAQILDPNIVVHTPAHLRKYFPQYATLLKALYGTKCSALSWEIWINQVMESLGYKQLLIARGVYTLSDENGEIIRAYRHSDDFLVNCFDEVSLDEQQERIKKDVRMSSFVPVDGFLGLEIERVDGITLHPSINGSIAFLRQRQKIKDMAKEYAKEIETMFSQFKPHRKPLPYNYNVPFDELTKPMQRLITPAELKRMQGVVGCLLWITSSTRPDSRFAVSVSSTRIAAPIYRDFVMAVYTAVHMIQTIDTPLVLGGPAPLNPSHMSDASLATGPKGRSPYGHFVRMQKDAGAIYGTVMYTKFVALNICHVELTGVVSAADLGIYCTNACNEMNVPIEQTRVLETDSGASEDFIKGTGTTAKSKHMSMRIHKIQGLYKAGVIDVEFVAGSENTADILTKSLDIYLHRKHARSILGHHLVLGKGIAGIIEIDPERDALEELVSILQISEADDIESCSREDECFNECDHTEYVFMMNAHLSEEAETALEDDSDENDVETTEKDSERKAVVDMSTDEENDQHRQSRSGNDKNQLRNKNGQFKAVTKVKRHLSSTSSTLENQMHHTISCSSSSLFTASNLDNRSPRFTPRSDEDDFISNVSNESELPIRHFVNSSSSSTNSLSTNLKTGQTSKSSSSSGLPQLRYSEIPTHQSTRILSDTSYTCGISESSYRRHQARNNNQIHQSDFAYIQTNNLWDNRRGSERWHMSTEGVKVKALTEWALITPHFDFEDHKKQLIDCVPPYCFRARANVGMEYIPMFFCKEDDGNGDSSMINTYNVLLFRFISMKNSPFVIYTTTDIGTEVVIRLASKGGNIEELLTKEGGFVEHHDRFGRIVYQEVRQRNRMEDIQFRCIANEVPHENNRSKYPRREIDHNVEENALLLNRKIIALRNECYHDENSLIITKNCYTNAQKSLDRVKDIEQVLSNQVKNNERNVDIAEYELAKKRVLLNHLIVQFEEIEDGVSQQQSVLMIHVDSDYLEEVLSDNVPGFRKPRSIALTESIDMKVYNTMAECVSADETFLQDLNDPLHVYYVLNKGEPDKPHFDADYVFEDMGFNPFHDDDLEDVKDEQNNYCRMAEHSSHMRYLHACENDEIENYQSDEFQQEQFVFALQDQVYKDRFYHTSIKSTAIEDYPERDDDFIDAIRHIRELVILRVFITESLCWGIVMRYNLEQCLLGNVLSDYALYRLQRILLKQEEFMRLKFNGSIPVVDAVSEEKTQICINRFRDMRFLYWVRVSSEHHIWNLYSYMDYFGRNQSRINVYDMICDKYQTSNNTLQCCQSKREFDFAIQGDMMLYALSYNRSFNNNPMTLNDCAWCVQRDTVRRKEYNMNCRSTDLKYNIRSETQIVKTVATMFHQKYLHQKDECHTEIISNLMFASLDYNIESKIRSYIHNLYVVEHPAVFGEFRVLKEEEMKFIVPHMYHIQLMNVMSIFLTNEESVQLKELIKVSVPCQDVDRVTVLPDHMLIILFNYVRDCQDQLGCARSLYLRSRDAYEQAFSVWGNNHNRYGEDSDDELSV